jgi:hypothetical protein
LYGVHIGYTRAWKRGYREEKLASERENPRSC